MVTLPSTYTPFKILYRKKRRLLSRERARQAATVAHEEEGLVRYIKFGTSKAKIAYDRRAAARNATKEAFDSLGRINNTIDDITWFMTAVPLPYFDPSSRKIHVGLACQGCKFALERSLEQMLSSRQHYALCDQRDRTYTESGIFEHFEWCSHGRAL